MNVKLHVFKSDGTSKELSLRDGQYLLGRGKDATLRIPLPSVSREHCLLTLKDGAVHVKDLGSSNGTFRNRQRITESTLEPGDTLGVGEVMMVIQIDGEPATIHPPSAAPASSDGSSMMDTPPPAPQAAPPRPAMPAPLVSEEDETTNELGSLPKSLSSDESSIFDFDFDFEDDDRPQL